MINKIENIAIVILSLSGAIGLAGFMLAVVWLNISEILQCK